MWYVLKINPEPWAIGPVGARRSGGKLGAFVGQNQQLNAYKEAVREALREQLKDHPLGPEYPLSKVDLTFFFWRNLPTYMTPRELEQRKHEADVTNLQKSTEDALQGILFDNDKDVVHIGSYLVEQGPEVEGRVIIKIEPADPVLNPDLIPEFVWGYVDQTQIQLPLDESSNVLSDSHDLYRGEVPF